MRTASKRLRIVAIACLLTAIAIGAAHAESATQAQANYKQDRNNCLNGQTGESMKTCLREADAALNDAKNGKLDKFNTNFEQNALARCQVFKNEEDRGLCERRQREGTVSGSVAGGGEIRELTVIVPADETSARTPSTSAPQQQNATPQPQQDDMRNQLN